MSIQRKNIVGRIIAMGELPNKPHIYLKCGIWVFIHSHTRLKNNAALEYVTSKNNAR